MADWLGHSDAATFDHELAHAAGKLRILVADDSRINRTVIAKILERAGYEVETVSGGEEALDALETGSFDLVLMDINMPVMSGIETAKLYRFIALGERRVPILGLTADATLETAARCAEAGMDGCVTKPVEPARLLELINEVASPREPPSPPTITASGQVTDIASHQRSRPASQPTFDRGTLASFEALGGRSFLTGLIRDFIADSELLVTDMVRAAEAGDIRLFRAQCGTLQSAASEFGAKALCDLCTDVRKVRSLPLNQGLVDRIARELHRVRRALLQHYAMAEGGNARILTLDRSRTSHPCAPS